MDGPPEGLTPDPPRRPRELAVLLLAAGVGPPRERARDQQADRAGGGVRRRVLDRVAALDPESVQLDQTLAGIVAEFGDPTGPTRAACAQFRQDWLDASAAPAYWAFLLAEALEHSSAEPGQRRRRRDDDTTGEAPRGAP